MLIKKLYFVFFMCVITHLTVVNCLAATEGDDEGLCGMPIKATLTPDLGDGVLYQSRSFQAQINFVETSSIEYQIMPLEEHLHNWEDWHPIHWIELFQITRALKDFSEKTGTLENAHSIKGFLLRGNQYIDEKTDSQKTKFIFSPCYSSDFSMERKDREFGSKRPTSPIKGNVVDPKADFFRSTLIRNTIKQFKTMSRFSILTESKSLFAPSFCHDCNYITKQSISNQQSEKPFWQHTRRDNVKGEIYYDITHAQHICSLDQCTDVMTLGLSQILLNLMTNISRESRSHNFDIYISSYNGTSNKHLICKFIPKILDYLDAREKSTDSESSEESAFSARLPAENSKSLVRQGKLKEIKIPIAVTSVQDPTPPPPSKKGQQRLRKTISDASKYNAWTDSTI